MKLEIREATLEDCQDIYDWRTHEKNKEYSYTHDDFSYKEHKGWFKDYLLEKGNLMLIAELNGKPCSVVRFDGDFSSKEVSIYMVPGFHGFGLGLQCLLLSERLLKEKLRGLQCNITAEIDQENCASTNMFTRAGYIYSMADWYKVI